MNSVATIDPAIEHIKEIIETQRQRYEQHELRQMLIADQHDPQVVDVALAQVFGLRVDAPAVMPQEAGHTAKVVFLAFGVFFGNAIILISLITAFSMLFSLVESFDGTLIAWTLPIIALVAAEAGLLLYLRRRRAIYTRGIAWGLGLTIGVVLALGAAFLGLVLLLANTRFN